MARPTFDRQRASRIVALANRAGDKAAAAHFGVSLKSVTRYRARVATDPELARAVREKSAEFEAASAGWAEEAAKFMASAIRKLSDLVEQAKPDQIRDVAGAVKIVGELDITRKSLGDEQPGTDSEGPAAEAAAGANEGRREGASGSALPIH